MPRRASVSSHRAKTAPLEGRVPPSNLEAEQSVLGGILLEPGALDRIADILAPEDFYHEAHEKIYQTMLELYRRREPVDLVTVTALMSDRQHLGCRRRSRFSGVIERQCRFCRQYRILGENRP